MKNPKQPKQLLGKIVDTKKAELSVLPFLFSAI
jgi:hypothetical protein